MIEPYLAAVPAALTMLGSLVYLWARRRRSPRAVGMAAAGLVGGLVIHVGGQFYLPLAWDYILGNGGLVGPTGLPVPLAITLVLTLQNAFPCGCLVLVVAAVVADRPPPLDDNI